MRDQSRFKPWMMTVFAVLVLSGVALAVGPTRISTGLDFTDGTSTAVSAANHARLRYNNTTHLLEQSLNTGAYVALGSGGGGASGGGAPPNGFRCSLQTGVAVPVTDQSAKTTIFLTPYRSQYIGLYYSSAWALIDSTQVSVAVGTVTSSVPIDVFASSSDGTTMSLSLVQWSNATTRATALTTQDGIYVKNGDTTKRAVCTVYPDSTTTVSDTAKMRGVWNFDNRVARSLLVSPLSGGGSFAYSLATIRAFNNDATNAVAVVRGLDEDAAQVTESVLATNTSTVIGTGGIGLDSCSTNNAVDGAAVIWNPAAGAIPLFAHWAGMAGLGYHYLCAEQAVQATGTTTWYGSGSGSSINYQSALSGTALQ